MLMKNINFVNENFTKNECRFLLQKLKVLFKYGKFYLITSQIQ